MRCEVCGRKIHGKPIRAMIEGAKLTVCSECSKHGTIIWEEPKTALQQQKPKTAMTMKTTPPKGQIGKPQKTVESPLELVVDFDVRIRRAREKLGLSHEDLGRKINEKVSVLKKIEARKIRPDDRLAAKLEHALKIKLLMPALEEKASSATIPESSRRELTLGDLIRINKGKTEEKA
ncbi:MAG: multiprotein bridging factor aMBF1 [Candidatus Bathyarchaeota archaeon]|nr:TIGR00270 family protein [Candidatus Bathyarchaeota archaeon A05DMB-3]MDH7606498.1 multiprotein bridging factor aMBF1 [Candidatus Bathyarchaeota archaeon]